MRALLLSLLLIFTLPTQAQGLNNTNTGFDFGADQPAFLPVEEAYQLALEPQPDGNLRLYWQIADEYYLYQHRFAFELHDEAGDIAVSAELPAALERTDEFFGDVNVYYQQADIGLSAARSSEVATLAVTSQGCADAGLCYPPHKQHYRIDFANASVTAIDPPAKGSKPHASAPATTTTAQPTLLLALVLAFLGGIILNLMPCVFPILSLKVLSFATSDERDRHSHGWWYTAGVITSFVLVAAVLIALQQAGRAVGWGFQLQSPGFVIALAYLFVAMGLSLSGLISFGGNIVNVGNDLASRQGHSGSFFTGVLAVVVASPCTAPFMGTALGFALTQPPYIALTIFAALGAGMASPLLALSYSSWLRRKMPRPGQWMETLKQLLAFPLYASAIWLLWVAGRQSGVNSMAIALTGILLMTLGLWLWRLGTWQRITAGLCLAIALALALWPDSHTPASAQQSSGEAWSEARVDELRRAGHPVFVDFTADWCITCIANEQTVLYTDEVRTAFTDHNIAYVVADWTNYDPTIAEFLARHGRNGIPFYLMYAPDADAAPEILPQLLTKSAVIEAAARAAGKL